MPQPDSAELELHGSYFPSDKFGDAPEQEAWPRLEDLSMNGWDERDEVIARTLSHLPPLHRFRLGSDKFGPLTFSTLRSRSLNTIKGLDLAWAIAVTSRMSLSVLEKCVHLEEFKTGIINADDIDTVSSSWPLWVC